MIPLNKIKRIPVVLIVIMLSSCIDDKGNYNYLSLDELMPVSIEKLEAKYNVYQGGRLRIDPVFTAIDDENRYTYTWYAMVRRSKTILSAKKLLDTIIALPQDEYALHFEVRDEKLDIFKSVSSKLSVTANIQNGWYILKSRDGTTDFDYRGVDGLHADNVMQTIAGNEELQGDALQILLQPDKYTTESTNESGAPVILREQKAIHVLSTKEFKTIDAARFRLFKKYDDQFYNPPAVRRPCGIYYHQDNTFYIDNALLYGSNFGGVGKYGSPFYYDEFNVDYEIFPSILLHKDKAIVFDTKSSTFYVAAYDPRNLKMTRFRASSDGASLTNMDMEMIGLFQRTPPGAYTPNGYALLKKKGTETHYLYTIQVTGFTTYPVTGINRVPANAEMVKAKVFGTHRMAECLYYSSDNRLCMYVNSATEHRESVLRTFPEGEEIAFIHHFVAAMPDEGQPVNTLAVATNNAEGWKVYLFVMVQDTPEISAEPKVVLSGAGKAKQVIYFNSEHK